jgi:hypothetical protein
MQTLAFPLAISTPQEQVTRRLRVDVGSRADVALMLRDYLRREGVDADLSGPASLDLTTAAPAATLRELLAVWERVTDAPAALIGDSGLRSNTQTGPAQPARPRLGELLVRHGFITEQQATFAVNEARETGLLVGVVLLRQQLIFEDELARTLSKQLEIPYVSVMRVGIDYSVASLVPPDVGESACAIPVRMDAAGVLVAFADPTDPGALAAIREHVPQFQLAVGELSDIAMAWRTARERGSGR